MESCWLLGGDRSNPHALSAAVVPQLRRIDVIVTIRHK